MMEMEILEAILNGICAYDLLFLYLCMHLFQQCWISKCINIHHISIVTVTVTVTVTVHFAHPSVCNCYYSFKIHVVANIFS